MENMRNVEDILIEEVHGWKCPRCNKLFEEKKVAYCCLETHINEDNINKDFFDNNLSLGQIIKKYGNIIWIWTYSLTEKQKTITKDNCFVIRHWQGCKKPAYKIERLFLHGMIKLGGVGGWSGYYSSVIKLDKYNLLDPRQKAELYEYKKGKL